MPRLITRASLEQEFALSRALQLLRRARDLVASADAPKAADKVRSALKSVEGAQRHMNRRRQETEKGK
ncbi:MULTISPECIES: hypothetical protein [unclassified Bradyrhizobium]|uniref:hypothetical protein n=1 Tax=unclassified Bradyrhizobium TaxID=2631580 RepID=UPI0028EDFC85|nr:MULTISPECIES: hypothetical protein [unclassified Bradyrhizobium]